MHNICPAIFAVHTGAIVRPGLHPLGERVCAQRCSHVRGQAVGVLSLLHHLVKYLQRNVVWISLGRIYYQLSFSARKPSFKVFPQAQLICYCLRPYVLLVIGLRGKLCAATIRDFLGPVHIVLWSQRGKIVHWICIGYLLAIYWLADSSNK